VKKSEFLRELRINLEGKITDDELESILMDYDEIFEAGLADNRTEDEISDMIGSPALVARNILDESSGNRGSATAIEDGYPLASLGKRVVAFLIDGILSLIPFIILFFFERPRILLSAVLPLLPYNPIFPIFIVLSNFMIVDPYSGSVFSDAYSWDLIKNTIIYHILPLSVSFLFFWLYGTLCMIIMKDRTIGMRIMNIKVVKKDGKALRPMDVFIRQFIGKVLLAGLTWNISYIVSFFWAAFSKTSNTIHDRLAGTIVIEDTGDTR